MHKAFSWTLKAFGMITLPIVAAAIGLNLPLVCFWIYETLVPHPQYAADSIFTLCLISSLVSFMATLAWLMGRR